MFVGGDEVNSVAFDLSVLAHLPWSAILRYRPTGMLCKVDSWGWSPEIAHYGYTPGWFWLVLWIPDARGHVEYSCNVRETDSFLANFEVVETWEVAQLREKEEER